MAVTVILPVKPFDEAKSRLAPVLAPSERATLSRLLFCHVLRIVSAMDGIARCIVVSRSAEALDLARQVGALAVEEIGNNLNGALGQAIATAAQDRPTPLLMLSTDLPSLTRDDLSAMLGHDDREVRIAPDRAGQGTNALFMARPGLIRPRFGAESFTAHRAAANHGGLRCTIVQRPGLAQDIDTPADLSRLLKNGGRAWARAMNPPINSAREMPRARSLV